MDKVFAQANQDKVAKLHEVIDEYRGKAGALITVLQKAQGIFGYLPEEVQSIIAERMRIPLPEVYGVTTFYSQFTMEPKGTHTIAVCLGTACYVKGAQQVLNAIKTELGIDVGETTPDGLFTIDTTRCIGACGLAPVMMIGKDVYGRLKPEDVKDILGKYRHQA